MIIPLYWAPAGYSFPASYKAVVNGFLQNVAGDSGRPTNPFSVLSQYTYQLDSQHPVGRLQYAFSVQPEVDLTDAFWAASQSGCGPDTGFAACATDNQLQQELMTRGCPTILAFPRRQCLWVVMLPPTVEACVNGGAPGSSGPCSANDFCAYHSAIPINAPSPTPNAGGFPDGIVYTNQPYPDLASCSDPYNGPQAPNGNAEADVQVNLISHEVMDATTAWDGTWSDGVHDQIADECLNVFGKPLGSTGGAGTFYNQVIGSGRYYIQDEFSNEDFAIGRGDVTTTGGTTVKGCVGREELPIASFTHSSPAYASTPVSFDASASYDPDNANIADSWFFDDGPPQQSSAAGVQVTHTFRYPGTYMVQLVVTDPGYWFSTVTIPVTVLYSPSEPTFSLYTLDGYGGIHGDATPPISSFTYWGWNIARTAKAWPGGPPSSGMVMDGYGGLHGFGAAPPVQTSGAAGHYWPGWQIARDFAFLPDGTGGFVLDGYGGLHPFRLNGNTSPLFAQGYPYSAGNDIYRKVVIFADGAGGYVMDKSGRLYMFGINGPPQSNGAIVQSAYWPGQNIARDVVLIPNTAEGTSGYVLDLFGGLHPFHLSTDGSPMPPAITAASWGFDIARTVWMLPGSPDAGYTLDGYGGIHPFGGAPPIASFPYWPGWDIARVIWGG